MLLNKTDMIPKSWETDINTKQYWWIIQLLCACSLSWAPPIEYKSICFLGRKKSKNSFLFWEFFSSAGSERRLLMSSLAQPLFCSRTLWHPLHVFSQRCPDNPRGHGSENYLVVTDGGWGSGQCHPFPLQHLSNLAWPQEDIHIRDSHPHGRGQCPGSSRSWHSPHNGNFCVKEPPV